VLDPDGKFLVPSGSGGSGGGGSGEGGGSGSGLAIPRPETLPDLDVGSGLERVRSDRRVERHIRTGDRSWTVVISRHGAFVDEYHYFLRTDGLWQIDRHDASGRRIDTLFYDPRGQVVTGVGDPDAVPEREEPPKPHRPWWPWALGAAVLLAAGLGTWWWWRRRRTAIADGPPTWVDEVREALERAGARRGRRRRRDESIVAYGRALDAETGPLAEAAALGELLSDAMFAGGPPPAAVEAQARALLAEVIAAPPPPDPAGASTGRRFRRRRPSR